MNLSRWTLAVLVGVLPLPGELLGCQYNVRDVGFVDLDQDTYRLCLFVTDRTPAELASFFRDRAAAVLRDCNLATEVVSAVSQMDHPASKFLRTDAADAIASVVLLSPDGQGLPLFSLRSGDSFRDRIDSVLNELKTSPVRDELIRAVVENFAAVLLVESPDSAANTRARSEISKAAEQIRAQMKQMPKLIARPPVLVALSAAASARERILLWSLGLPPSPPVEPRVAVIYGRARWIGPLMKGREITERNVAGILSIIGADCECDLDISWTQGTRLPVTWAERIHAQLTQALGFDPENPLVKMEASRIAGRRGLLTRAGGRFDEASGRTPRPDTNGAAVLPRNSLKTALAHAQPVEASEPLRSGQGWWLALGGVGLVVIGTGLLIVFRRG